ncbi:MAG: hypothetical protein KDK30_17815, partial [Leptospiraceae bacterium]|nr:hypothetical protein [Leptospiraceae bacterium]
DDLRDMYESYFAKTTRVAMRNRDEITPSDERDAEFQQLIMKQDEIESVAGQIADKTVEMEFSGLFQNRVRRLFEDKEVEFHETLQGGIPDEASLTPDTPLYTINGETYTYADLNNEIQDADFPLGDKFMMLSTLLTYRVLEDQEDFNSISTDADDYRFFRQLREDQLLASLYLQQNMPEVRVTEEQIRERAESAMRFNQMSYAQVRDQVKAQLENEQRQAKLNEMKQAMSEKYNLQIHADKLEAHEL